MFEIEVLAKFAYALIHSPWAWASWAGLLIFGYSWTTKTDNVDASAAAHINLLQTEKLDRDGAVRLTAGLQWPALVASADVNTLDDYREGTWTPTRVDFSDTLGGGTITSTGYYTRIGRLVHLVCYIVCAGGAKTAATAGTAYITGLPYSAAVPAAGSWANLATGAEGGAIGISASVLYICTSWSDVINMNYTLTATIHV